MIKLTMSVVMIYHSYTIGEEIALAHTKISSYTIAKLIIARSLKIVPRIILV